MALSLAVPVKVVFYTFPGVSYTTFRIPGSIIYKTITK